MKTQALISALFLSALFLVVACGNTPAERASTNNPAGSPTLTAASKPVTYSAFEVSWPRPSARDVAKRARGIAEVMLGERLAEGALVSELTAATAPGRLLFSAALGRAGVDLQGEYRHGADEMVLSNDQLAQDSSGPDIGELAAQARCDQALQRLADAGVLERDLFDVGSALVSKTLEGTGSSDTSGQQERVLSYDFLVRQKLNGLPFANAGVRISIHRSGAIQGIRLGGARVAATRTAGTLVPASPGYTFRAKLDEAYYAGRFAQDYPHGQIRSQGVMYILPKSVDPEAGTKHVLEPRYVFSYSNHAGEFAGRRRYVAYSLSAREEPAVDLDAPAVPMPVGGDTPTKLEPSSPVGE